MKMSYLLFASFVLVALVLSGCDDSANDGVVRSNPFRGGTESVSIIFETDNPPRETFADIPFSVILKVRNTGEYTIPQNEFKVKIQGFNPDTYGLSVAQTERTANMDLLGTVFDVDRNVIQGTEDYIEFGPLGYRETLNTLLQVPIQAIACYSYGTNVVSNICIKTDVSRDMPGDVCVVNENKPVYTSSGPIQVTSLKQSPRGSNTIAINFQVEHKGVGEFFNPSVAASCELPERNRVFITVDGPAGIDCPALGGGSSGMVTLSETTGRLISCTLDVSSASSNYVQPININIEYNYKQTIMRSVEIKPVN